MLGLMIMPFMPDSAGKILDQLAVPADARDFASFGKTLRPSAALPKPQPVFPRYVEETAAVGAGR
jgi:methionyl-tRNA synthetase